jgi:hypothetical protein
VTTAWHEHEDGGGWHGHQVEAHDHVLLETALKELHAWRCAPTYSPEVQDMLMEYDHTAQECSIKQELEEGVVRSGQR